MNSTAEASAPVALITGSGRKRIGYHVAMGLARRGYRIGVHYRTADREAQETVADIRAAGGEAAAWRADVGDESDVERLVDQVVEEFGRIDALVTTASIWRSRSLEELDATEILENFKVNALGTLLCARQAGLRMIEQTSGGCIITIGDWALSRPYPNYAAYFAAKGAVEAMTKALAVELAERNPRVRVNCLHPGPVLFPEGMTPERQQAVRESTLVKDANCPESMVAAVQFLIDSPFVTGVSLPVDGGRTIFSPGDLTTKD